MRVDTLRAVTLARLVKVSTTATLRTSAVALSNPHVGLVVVCNASGEAIGVVTKSDLIHHLKDVGLSDAPVAILMSQNIAACGPEDDLYDTWHWMTAQERQNIPVLDAASMPLGVLDIRDALKALLEQEEYQERLLTNYVAGVGYQ